MTVELHPAFHWDCDECGRENFVRAVSGDLDEASMTAALEGTPTLSFEVPEEWVDVDEDSEEFAAAAVVTRICIVPHHVKCQHCGKTFESEEPGDTEPA